MKHETLLGGGVLIVLHNVGLLLRYMAAVPLLLVPVALWFDEERMVPPVLVTSLVFFLAGVALSLLPTRREPRLREGLLIAAVGWLLVPLVSVFVFVLGEGWPLLDAYFETMSAWTGTGMTIADVTALSQTTLFWRSLMQWVGGLGVIVLTLAILARPGTGAFTLYAGEGREDKLRPSVLSTVRTLWKIYVGLTLASIALLLLVDYPFWHALNHGMTGISTAGMSILPGGIGDYEEPAKRLAIIPIMIMGALPFVATYALLRGRWPRFLKDEQVKAMAVVLPVVVILLALALRAPTRFLPVEATFLDALFQGVSAVTTTGFQTVDISQWSERAKLFLSGAMLLGGAAGSTAGGIKLVRGVLLVKGALWKLRKSGLPHFAVTTFPFGNERLNDQEANEEFAEASFILVLWVATLFTGLLLFITFVPARWGLDDVIFEVASLQANIGLSTGIISPLLPDAAKVTAMLLMWAGRLEILPVLLLLRGLIPRIGKR